MNPSRMLALVFISAAVTLACDLTFGTQEKFARYIEPTPGVSGTSTYPVPDANATPTATADANRTPSASDASATHPPAPPRAAPAVLVTSIRVDPPQPRSGPNPVTFFVRFQSTFATKQSVRWITKIFRPGESKSFGETAALISDIPPGVSEIMSANNWHTNPIQCEVFSARVYWFDGVLAEPIEFKKPDATSTPFVEFKICP